MALPGPHLLSYTGPSKFSRFVQIQITMRQAGLCCQKIVFQTFQEKMQRQLSGEPRHQGSQLQKERIKAVFFHFILVKELF